MPAHDDARPPRIVHLAAALALGLLAATCAAEKFVYFGAQPDGSEIFVQVTPPAHRTDGKVQGWFRTVPKAPRPVTDEFGFERPWVDFVALNVADCDVRRMAAAAIHYRDAAGTVVAKFELAPNAIDYREVGPSTLGANMLAWLCAPPAPGGRLPPSAASQTPFK
jgi:hypothetical protein